MKYSESCYIGRNIELFPGDSCKRIGKIIAVDDLGWTIEVVASTTSSYIVGERYFFSHSQPFVFRFIK